MLQYILCVSRFAHYVKVIARDRVGEFTDAATLERVLRDWLFEYVTPDEDASPTVKARRPLRDAEVQVSPDPGSPGKLRCLVRLMPHFQFEDMVVSIDLKTSLMPSNDAATAR